MFQQFIQAESFNQKEHVRRTSCALILIEWKWNGQPTISHSTLQLYFDKIQIKCTNKVNRANRVQLITFSRWLRLSESRKKKSPQHNDTIQLQSKWNVEN